MASRPLKKAQGLFPASVGDVRRLFQRVQPLTQLENQLKAGFRQRHLVDLRLPLQKLFVADAQRRRHRVLALVLAVDQQRAEILFILHLVQPQADQHAVI